MAILYYMYVVEVDFSSVYNCLVNIRKPSVNRARVAFCTQGRNTRKSIVASLDLLNRFMSPSNFIDRFKAVLLMRFYVVCFGVHFCTVVTLYVP